MQKFPSDTVPHVIDSPTWRCATKQYTHSRSEHYTARETALQKFNLRTSPSRYLYTTHSLSQVCHSFRCALFILYLPSYCHPVNYYCRLNRRALLLNYITTTILPCCQIIIVEIYYCHPFQVCNWYLINLIYCHPVMPANY